MMDPFVSLGQNTSQQFAWKFCITFQLLRNEYCNPTVRPTTHVYYYKNNEKTLKAYKKENDVYATYYKYRPEHRRAFAIRSGRAA